MNGILHRDIACTAIDYFHQIGETVVWCFSSRRICFTATIGLAGSRLWSSSVSCKS
jgi:hypothetical protein